MRVHDEVLDLFIELEADDEQLDAPFVYASAREGVAALDRSTIRSSISRRCSTPSSAHVPPPPSNAEGPFQMLVSTIDYSPYLGRLAIGRVERGTVKLGQTIALPPARRDAARS